MKLSNKFDWLYITLTILILVISAILRFVPPTQPTQPGLVFDESYFVPQVESYAVNRFFHDPHPPLGKFILYAGMMLYNPDAAELIDGSILGNKVDNYESPLNLEGIRFFPKVAGALLSVVVFMLVFELVNWNKKDRYNFRGYAWGTMAGLLVTFENSIVLDSRYGLLTAPLLLSICTSVLFSIWFFKSSGRKQFILLLCTAITFGMAFSIKWLALSVAPFIIGIIVYRFWGLLRTGHRGLFLSNVYNSVLILFILAFCVYYLSYAWHFSQFKYYSLAAEEMMPSYVDDLKNGTSNTSTWAIFWDTQRENLEYEKGVPALDYSKSGEIGSMWVTWPIMARPISYFWSTSGDGTYAFAYSIGNPFIWLISLFGVILSCGLLVSRLLQGYQVGRSNFGIKHFLLLLLYFANWLPYALVARVMYIYHYLPALLIGVVLFILVINDFLVPRLNDLVDRYSKVLLREIENRSSLFATIKNSSINFVYVLIQNWEIVLYGLLIAFAITLFWIYSPFTYVQPLTEEQFQQRYLLKEWNLRWPGN